MIGGCLTSAMYPLEADVYSKKRTISSTGQISYTWEFLKTVPCSVVTFGSTSFKAQAVSETFGEMYDKMTYVILKSKDEVGRNVRVVNIRNSQGTIFKEIELRGNPPTWFDASGSNPKTDPFGSVLEFETLLSRSEEQGELA